MRENLKATKSFTYAGRALKAGDPFSATRADARTLRAIGRAAPAVTYQTTEAKAEVTKDMPKGTQATKPEARQGAPKRSYNKKAAAQ